MAYSSSNRICAREHFNISPFRLNVYSGRVWGDCGWQNKPNLHQSVTHTALNKAINNENRWRRSHHQKYTSILCPSSALSSAHFKPKSVCPRIHTHNSPFFGLVICHDDHFFFGCCCGRVCVRHPHTIVFVLLCLDSDGGTLLICMTHTHHQTWANEIKHCVRRRQHDDAQQTLY